MAPKKVLHYSNKWVDLIICTCWKGTFRLSASEEVKENLDKLLKKISELYNVPIKSKEFWL